MIHNAIFAGSFDPITNGHLNIIERASRIVDSLTVLVCNNMNKTYMLDKDLRLDLVRQTIDSFPNVKADYTDGLLADYILKHDINLYIRGIRNSQDYTSESQMFAMNKALIGKSCEMIYILSDLEFSHINSSMVREIFKLGGDITSFVPDAVLRILKKEF